MSDGTAKRHRDHIREFLKFVEADKRRPATLDDVMDIATAWGFIEDRTRGLSSGTAANYVQSLIALAKYNLRDTKTNSKWDELPEVAQLRHMQNQLQVEFNMVYRLKVFRCIQ